MDELIDLTSGERNELEAILSANLSAKEFKRAQALLLLDENNSVAEVAELLRTSRQTIYNWVARFQLRRLTTGQKLDNLPPANKIEVLKVGH